MENCAAPAPTGGGAGSSVDRNDLFSLELFYDQTPGSGTTTVPQRNGNISGYHYRTRGRTTQAYAFEYDGLNRLRAADHAQQLSGGGYERDAYNTAYTYDLRGNITTLRRQGKAADEAGCLVSGQVDNLTYTYGNGTNRLEHITDGAVNPSETAFVGAEGYHRPATAPDLDYQYDANGNLIYDPSRELTIYYNYLNLPERFEFEDCRTIEVTYDASGMKLRTVTANGSQPVRDQVYAGGLEYVNGRLESVPHPEGRTYYENGDSRQEYNLTDHLGNTRVVFSDLNGNGQIEMHADAPRSEVLLEEQYYPFGLAMVGNWLADIGRGTRYRYNGMERSDELGLDLAFYRSYDPAIGRWLQTDPAAEKYYGMSPYSGMGNNPINIADPLGDTLWILTSYGDMNDAGGNAIVNDQGEILAGNGHTRMAYTPGMSGNGNGGFIDEIVGALNYIYENIGTEALDEIMGDAKHSTLLPQRNTTKAGSAAYYFDDNRDGSGGSYLMANLSLGMDFHESTASPNFLQYVFGDWGYRSPTEAVNHELQHNASYFINPIQHTIDTDSYDPQYGNIEERQSIQAENTAATTLYGANAVMRIHHGGQMTQRRYGLFPKR